MDNTEIISLTHLRKYVNFMEYIINNEEYNMKFQEIKKWIKCNERVKKDVSNKIEYVLKYQYTKLLSKNKKLPEWIHELFKDQVEHVDLQSSDDENDENVDASNQIVQIDLQSSDEDDNNNDIEMENQAIKIELQSNDTGNVDVEDDNDINNAINKDIKKDIDNDINKDNDNDNNVEDKNNNIEDRDINMEDIAPNVYWIKVENTTINYIEENDLDNTTNTFESDENILQICGNDNNDNYNVNDVKDDNNDRLTNVNSCNVINEAESSKNVVEYPNNNYPIVLLKRLSSAEIDRIINNSRNYEEAIKPLPILDVELIESTIQNDERFNTARKTKKHEEEMNLTNYNLYEKFTTNIDINMIESNTRKCTLCPSKPHNLTNHYVRMHKIESYVSRLTARALARMRKAITFAWPAEEVLLTKENYNKIKLMLNCPFCECTITDLFQNFYNHFSSHTGEYAYVCISCKLKKPYLAEVLAHKSRSRICSVSGISTLYVYNDKQLFINIYRCCLCNFVQLNEANIIKHLHDHHGTLYGSTDIEKLIIAAIQRNSDNEFDFK